MQGLMLKWVPRRRSPSTLSIAGPIHPCRRSRVPTPACTPGVRRSAIHVAGHHVRLSFVALDFHRGARMVDRIQHVEHFSDLVATSQLRQRHHDPDRGMRVLPAVLSHARRVSLDVPGSWVDRSKGGSSRRSSCDSRAMSAVRTASMARSAKRCGTAPESTAQDWAIESILHSSFCAEPSADPSS